MAAAVFIKCFVCVLLLYFCQGNSCNYFQTPHVAPMHPWTFKFGPNGEAPGHRLRKKNYNSAPCSEENAAVYWCVCVCAAKSDALLNTRIGAFGSMQCLLLLIKIVCTLMEFLEKIRPNERGFCLRSWWGHCMQNLGNPTSITTTTLCIRLALASWDSSQCTIIVFFSYLPTFLTPYLYISYLFQQNL